MFEKANESQNPIKLQLPNSEKRQQSELAARDG